MNMRLAMLAFLTFLLSAQTVPAQTLLTVTVTADQTKAKGSPWDGPPGVSEARVPVPRQRTAPDLAICIIEPNKPAKCEQRAAMGRSLSICQNAFQCRFDRLRAPEKPFGLVILDLDLKRNDLVDLAVVVPDSHPQQAEVEAADIALRRQIETLAPSTAESEHLRRQKDFPILVLSQCANPCRLTQSEIRIERIKAK